MAKFLTAMFLVLASMSFMEQKIYAQPLFTSYSFHELEQIDYNGSWVSIRNGTTWKTTSSLPQNCTQWLTGEPLELIARDSYGVRYLVLKHVRTGSEFSVQLSLGPLNRHPATETIVEFNDYTGEIYIFSQEHGETRWIVDPRDRNEILSWSTKQAVLIGKNETDWSWGVLEHFFDTYDKILLNVEKNKAVRARLY